MSTQSILPQVLEFTCYFARLPEKEITDELFSRIISELAPAPSSVQFLDDRFKEQKKKYTPGIVEELLSQGSHRDILSIIVSSKVRGEDNRFPSASCSLSRISYGQPGIYSFSIRVDVAPEISAQQRVLNWCKSVQPLGACYGFGSNRAKFNLDFDYGNMHLMHVEEPNEQYRIAAENIQKFREDQSGFLDVAKGNALRSIFAMNLIGSELYGRIVRHYEFKSSPLPGRSVAVEADRILWCLDTAPERKDAFETLKESGLLFDADLLDLEAYVPAGSAFSIHAG
jgi:hypothetical protein